MTRHRTGKLLSVLLAIAVAGAAFAAACGRTADAEARYHCPMHPTYVSDKPGDCPICGMRLVPIEKDSGTAPEKHSETASEKHSGSASETSGSQETIYTCPMHPEVRQHEPGRCPICGMDLVPEKKATESAPHKHEPAPQKPEPVPHEHEPAPQKSEPGKPTGHEGHTLGTQPGGSREATGTGSVVTLTAGGQRLAGVRTAAAKKGRVTRDIRTAGTVEADETRIRQVTTKVAGFVEKLHVSATGQYVKAGQPMFELYSPELLASQEEYLRAREAAARFAASALPEVRRGGTDLVETARRRLELFDVPAEFLDRLEKSGTAERRVVFRAPFNGHLVEKNLVEGQRVEPGMPLLTLSDLSRIWVKAQVYEAETLAARVGRPATVTLPHDPSVKLAGRVSFIYPTLEADTRTLQVRLEFPNPRLVLKPGMFVNVHIGAEDETGVVVPDSAILDSGTRSLVFVELSPGRFEPREVQTGVRAGGEAIVRSGLSAGEMVAVSANFLLDSESRLRNAIGM